MENYEKGLSYEKQVVENIRTILEKEAYLWNMCPEEILLDNNLITSYNDANQKRKAIRPTNISNRYPTVKKNEPFKNEETSEMNYSKMKKDLLKALCKERKINGITGKSKNDLIEMILKRDTMVVSAPETDVKAISRVKLEMNWIPWSEKSKDIPFKSTITGIGDGEQKMERELDSPILGQNKAYDMMPIINGIKTKCEIKKLDTQNDFNTGKEGRDALRPIKMLHTIFLESINIFIKSHLFTPEEKANLMLLENVSPDELAVGTLNKLEQIFFMLNLKKKTILSMLPVVPFTAYEQKTEMSLDIYYYNCQKVKGLFFPAKFSPYIETILNLQKMDHIYIDEPRKFREDLNALVNKLFIDIRLILVNKDKGYMILPDTGKIRFYRITRGHPRFQVIF